MSRARFDVFISYRRNSGRADAINIQQFLEQAGFSCFRDLRDIIPGDEWRATIQEAIAGSRVVVVVIRDDFLTQKNQYEVPRIRAEGDVVREEIRLALEGRTDRGVEVIPVSIACTSRHPLADPKWWPADLADITSLNGCDIGSTSGDDLETLLKAVNDQIGPEEPREENDGTSGAAGAAPSLQGRDSGPADLPIPDVRRRRTRIVGVVDGGTGRQFIAVDGDQLSITDEDGTESVTRPFDLVPSTVVVSTDGELVVAGDSDAVQIATLGQGTVTLSAVLEAPGTIRLLNAWQDGPYAYLGRLTDGGSPQIRVALESGKISGWEPPPELGPPQEWTALVESDRSFCAVGMNGELRPSGRFARAFGSVDRSGWLSLDASTASSRDSTCVQDVAGLRLRDDGTVELHLVTGVGDDWGPSSISRFLATDGLMLLRPKPQSAAGSVFAYQSGELLGWSLDSLFPTGTR